MGVAHVVKYLRCRVAGSRRVFGLLQPCSVIVVTRKLVGSFGTYKAPASLAAKQPSNFNYHSRTAGYEVHHGYFYNHSKLSSANQIGLAFSIVD